MSWSTPSMTRAITSVMKRALARTEFSTTPTDKRSVAQIAGCVALAWMMLSLPNVHGQSTDRYEPAVRQLPADNVALFASDNPNVTVQLTSLDKTIASSLGGSSITVIRPNKQTETLSVDASGQAIISGVQGGLHVLVASHPAAHATIAVALRAVAPKSDETKKADPFALDFERAPEISPIQIPLLPINVKTLLPIVQNNLAHSDAIGVNIIDPAVINDDLPAAGFEYKIQLGGDGFLRGRLFSVVQPGSRYSRLQGTAIVIFKNGVPVGKTTANALGQFQIKGLQPGTHGLVVAGRGGYAAFGFEAVTSDGLLARSDGSRSFAYSQLMNEGEIMPVVLSPPAMTQLLAQTVTTHSKTYDEARQRKTIDNATRQIDGAARQRESQQILAQNSGPGIEDIENFQKIRNALSLESAQKSRQRVAEQTADRPAADQPDAQAKRGPVNPLRLAADRDPNVPFNPLRP